MYSQPERREIPDVALDKHTARGRPDGPRGADQFFAEGTVLSPHVPLPDEERWRELAREAIESGGPQGDVEPSPQSKETALASRGVRPQARQCPQPVHERRCKLDDAMTAAAKKRSGAPLTDQLAGLREQTVTSRGQHREATLAQTAAVNAIELTRQARIEALSRDDEQTAARLADERDQAERTAADRADRAEAAERRLQQIEAEQRAFAAEHLTGLLREREPEAEAVALAVEEAVAHLSRAHTQ